MHIDNPQNTPGCTFTCHNKTIFLIWNIWSYFVLRSCISGMWIMQNVMSLSKQWGCGCNEETAARRKHLYYVIYRMFLCVYQRETKIISLPLQTPYFFLSLSPVLWFMFVCLALCVCLCVCQTPLLHPLLHLISQLHTGRERGLLMRVCTYHITSFTLHVFLSNPILYNIFSQFLALNISQLQ